MRICLARRLAHDANAIAFSLARRRPARRRVRRRRIDARRRRPTPACTWSRPTTPTSSTRAGSTSPTPSSRSSRSARRTSPRASRASASRRRSRTSTATACGAITTTPSSTARSPRRSRSTTTITMYEYQVATDLPYGEHESRSSSAPSRTSASASSAGFEIAGVILPPPDRPAHKMLFFGDSITAGSGTEVPDGDPGCSADGWGQPVENADAAYGPVAARMLDADYHVVGVSGIGLVRNYQQQSQHGDIRPMPQVYNLTLPEMHRRLGDLDARELPARRDRRRARHQRLLARAPQTRQHAGRRARDHGRRDVRDRVHRVRRCAARRLSRRPHLRDGEPDAGRRLADRRLHVEDQPSRRPSPWSRTTTRPAATARFTRCSSAKVGRRLRHAPERRRPDDDRDRAGDGREDGARLVGGAL